MVREGHSGGDDGYLREARRRSEEGRGLGCCEGVGEGEFGDGDDDELW